MNSTEKIKLYRNASIKEAIEVIGQGALKIAIVIDYDQKLIGTLTDGDLRQAFLKGKTINDTIEGIYFDKPTVAKNNTSIQELIKLCSEKNISQIPIIDENGHAIGIHLLDELLKPKKYSNKVVLMVGGLGTRLRPLTNKIPKPMLPIGSKPILETIILNFKKHGFTNFILSVNYKSHIIEEYFKDGEKFGVNIEYIHEKKRMGTAGALSFLKDKIQESFFVMNGDLLTNINFCDMMEYHINNNADATMGIREYDFQVPYGVVKLNENIITEIKEKPVEKFFVSGGVYILNKNILELINNNEFYDMPTLFTDIINKQMKSISYIIDDYWLDIGMIHEYEKANEEYYKIF